MSERANRIGRAVITITGVIITAVLAWWLFLVVPGSLWELIGVVMVLAGVLVGARFASRAAGSAIPRYNVAEVVVEGPITRDGGGLLPNRPGGVSADDVVEQIGFADEVRGAKALILKLNTPGGQVVPSDDIRRAAVEFDGPTIAYATDVCASGGYWIATGCDEFWTHEASLVGSIGVIGSRVNASELVENLGVSYERITAGKFKDAGNPLKQVTEEERSYLQGIVDNYYDHFVSRVVESRAIDAERVKETEARVYLGEEALEVGLVDEVGTRDEMEDRVEDLLDEPVVVKKFIPEKSLTERLRESAREVAHAFGAGIASKFVQDSEFNLQYR